MGWKIKITKKKYRIWSTIVDKYITKEMPKDELIRFLFWHRFEGLIDEMLKDILCFPHGWIDKKTDKYLPCEFTKLDEYYSILKDRNKKFELFFTKIKEAGIFIDMKEADNKIHIHN